jgi:hypothetical protein
MKKVNKSRNGILCVEQEWKCYFDNLNRNNTQAG